MSKRRRNVRAEGGIGGCAGVGETDREALDAIAERPLRDMSPLLGARDGESGIGLDYYLLVIILHESQGAY